MIDEDFAGDSDEIIAHVLNVSDKKQTIERGDKIFQLVVTPFKQVENIEVDSMDNPDRGGFGSTD